MPTSATYTVFLVVRCSDGQWRMYGVGEFTSDQVEDIKKTLYGDVLAQHDLTLTQEILSRLETWHYQCKSHFLPRGFVEEARQGSGFKLNIYVN